MKEGERFDLNSYEDLKPGRWLKVGHLCNEQRTLTVKEAWGECFGTDKKTGRDIIRGVLSFEETELQYGTPKTVDKCLSAMFGNKPSDLAGKRITFMPDKDKFGADLVDCIRVAGSPDLQEPVECLVKYAPRTGRPPKRFNLRVTDAPMGLPGVTLPPTEEQLEQALGAIAGATAETLEPVLVTLREHAWTKDQSKKIKDAIAKVKGSG